MRRPRRIAAVALAGALAAATLSACSSGPDADPVAQALAEAFQDGSFDSVAWSGTDPAAVTAEAETLLGGLADVPRQVEVDDIERVGDDDGRREVTLEFRWDLDGSDADWTYTTTAGLVLGDGGDPAWAVEWQPSVLHPQLAAGATLAVSRVQPPRADVLGADGTDIVTERPVHRIGIDKTKADAGSWGPSAAALAELTGIDPAAYPARVEQAGERAFVEAITLREPDAADVLAGIEGIPGAVALSDTLPLAPTREFARPVLGTVGEATAEIVAESGGAVQAGDVVGLSGIQAQYDEQLRGVPGMTVEVVPADGAGEVLYEREPQPGTAVTTSIDTDLQVRAEEVLAGVAPPSAIVAVRPSTGAVLAVASGPGGDGYSTATLGQYAPGSTFKVVTALALLRAGSTPQTVVPCTPTVEVDGKGFKNYDDYPSSALGDISLRTAIANSCNTALIDQRDAVAQPDLAAAATALGLATPSDPGVPAFVGEVPGEAESTEHAASMIGQGRVLASPLGMAAVAASVVAGTSVQPWIVDTAASPAAAPGAVTAEEAAVLRDLMRAVVTEGSATFLGDVPGDAVMAKTGTAEYGTETPLRTHAWMIAAQGDLAVAVFVEDGESGSQTAGPLLERFLSGG
ncbi:MAG TPA: penicillin-binding transpeptidase domain-containing protein [Jiangellaceae bacterium]